MMQIFLLLLSAVCGGCIGYLIFYRKYENRELVNELRKHNIELKQMFQSCDRDRMEYEQQNEILKDEISELYQKNDDLTHVVSELSRYYYHMKKISTKMSELSQYLQQPLDDLDQKMSPYFSHSEDKQRPEEFIYRLDDEDHENKGGFF